MGVKPILTIGSVAKALAVTPETVRNMERAGLVQPVRDSANRRIYSEAQLAALRAYRHSRDGTKEVA